MCTPQLQIKRRGSRFWKRKGRRLPCLKKANPMAEATDLRHQGMDSELARRRRFPTDISRI